MQRTRVLILAALLLVALGSSLVLAAESPEEVAELYYRAAQEWHWKAVADLMDPAELQTLKEIMVELVSLMQEDTPDSDEFISMLLGPDASREDIHDVDPAVMIANILSLTAEASSITINDYQVIGTVYETPQLAHVVARNSVSVYTVGGATAWSGVEVISLVMTPEGWRVSSGGQIDSMLTALRSIVAQVRLLQAAGGAQ